MKNFHYYNANSKSNVTDDCVVRAIAKALDQSWEETLKGLTEVALEMALMPNAPKCYKEYLKRKGYERKPRPKKGNRYYKIGEFAKENNKGIYLLALARHLTVIEDGICYDLWDCTKRTMNGGYWEIG